MKVIVTLFTVLAFMATPTSDTANNLHDFSVQDIRGNEVDLSAYAGQVVMVVNTASKCGFTGQYEDLQSLYSEYKDRGLVILGFPSGILPGRSLSRKKRLLNSARLITALSFRCFHHRSQRLAATSPVFLLNHR